MKHKHVFICGLHRSGTSLLHRMLCDYEDVSGFSGTGVPEDEGQHLQTVFKSAKNYGGPGEFALDHSAYMNENHPLVNDQSRLRLTEEWGAHWDMKKHILVEKSPPTLIRSRFFQALFPDSAFIFLRRHPIAVTMATKKWNSAPIGRMMHHWVHAHQLMEADIPYLKKGIQLTYEELATNPEATMSRVERFLNLPKMEISREVRDGINDSYFSLWNDYVTRGEVVPSDIAPLAKECKRLGYDISDFI
jgi:hypothetical protein